MPFRILIRVAVMFLVLFGVLAYVLFSLIIDLVTTYPLLAGGGLGAGVLALAAVGIGAMVRSAQQKKRWEAIQEEDVVTSA